MANSVDPDNFTHYALPHLDLCCLKIEYIFSIFVPLKLKNPEKIILKSDFTETCIYH